jgi:hypothetical protein
MKKKEKHKKLSKTVPKPPKTFQQKPREETPQFQQHSAFQKPSISNTKNNFTSEIENI